MSTTTEDQGNVSRARSENVDGIDCWIREDDDIVEYTPYNGVFKDYDTLVAAVGEIPEHLKEKVKSKCKDALTFSFPSMGMKFGKTEHGVKIAARNVVEYPKESNKYYFEAFQKALSASPSLGSSSSAMRRTGSSPPMIQVCMNPTLRSNPQLSLCLSNKIRDNVGHRYLSEC